MPFHPDDFRAGQVLSATTLNELVGELERLNKIATAAPLDHANDAAGVRFAVTVPEVWWVKLTAAGTGGKYAWTRMMGVSGGTWTTHSGGQTGTTTVDPAVESTGKADVTTGTSAVYRAERDPVSRTLFFTAGSC
jgi:hypothetical protein